MEKRLHVKLSRILERPAVHIAQINLQTSFIDYHRQLACFIQKLLRAYYFQGLFAKREASLTPSIILHILKEAKSNQSTFVDCLIIGAFFFANKFYNFISASREPRTEIMLTNQISFYRKSKEHLLISIKLLSLR